MVVATWTTGGSWRKVLALKIIEAPQPAKADELTAEGIHCNRCVVTLNRIESSIKTDHNPLSHRYPIVLIEHDCYHIYRNPIVFKKWDEYPIDPLSLYPLGPMASIPTLLARNTIRDSVDRLCDCWAVNNDMARSTWSFSDLGSTKMFGS